MSESLSISDLSKYAEAFHVPMVDVLMIAANYYGAFCEDGTLRSRMLIKPNCSSLAWQTILALGAEDSPFRIRDKVLWLSGEPVASIVRAENDDVVLSYIRAGGLNLTLNTYSRSSCTGCVFCPNVIETAADEVVRGVARFTGLFKWVIKDHGWQDLASVESITLCTGCFKDPEAAISHLREIKTAASDFGFSGRMHFLSSGLQNLKHLKQAADELSPFHLTLTLECFERRDLILKQSKASLTVEAARHILSNCRELGITADFTYIAGLDRLPTAVAGLRSFAKLVTTFPRIQVFQAHNNYMRFYRAPDALKLDYFLQLRGEVEDAFSGTALRPRYFENYRPLWYSYFQNSPMTGPFV
jgi:hypothetical protein